MLLSFVVTAYNLEEYIGRCLDSILSQSGDYEVIVVDDSSTDNTRGILHKYSPRLSIIELESNHGCSYARNRGIEQAKGDYICLVDGDDWLSGDYVQAVSNDLLSYSPDALVINSALIYGRLLFGNAFNRHSFFTSSPFEVFETIIAPAQNFIFRREVYKDVRFPEGKYFEDLFTVPRLIDGCSSLFLENSPVYLFQKNRKGSITYDMTDRKKQDYIEGLSFILSEYRDRLTERGLHNVEVMLSSVLETWKNN